MATRPDSDDRPIGLLDSGIGGLTIWRAVRRLLPQESLVYAADQAYFPYGDKPDDVLRRRAELVSGRLIEMGAKLIVVACNTASVQALADLRAAYPMTPFVGVVPVIKTLSRVTKTGVIAVLCTPSTAQSAYIRMLAGQFAADKRVLVIECPGLADRLEAGELRSPATRALLERLLRPVSDVRADTLGLGSTHYPLVKGAIKRILGPGVRVYEPSRPVARRVRQVLTEMGALSGQEAPSYEFYTTGRPERLRAIVERLLRLPEARVRRL